jgi:hypothetical protein
VNWVDPNGLQMTETLILIGGEKLVEALISLGIGGLIGQTIVKVVDTIDQSPRTTSISDIPITTLPL